MRFEVGFDLLRQIDCLLCRRERKSGEKEKGEGCFHEGCHGFALLQCRGDMGQRVAETSVDSVEGRRAVRRL